MDDDGDLEAEWKAACATVAAKGTKRKRAHSSSTRIKKKPKLVESSKVTYWEVVKRYFDACMAERENPLHQLDWKHLHADQRRSWWLRFKQKHGQYEAVVHVMETSPELFVGRTCKETWDLLCRCIGMKSLRYNVIPRAGFDWGGAKRAGCVARILRRSPI